jgi:hypothetical protein
MVATDPRERLLELAGERKVSLAQLSAMIGRNSSYLQQFVRKGSPRKLEETDRAMLAGFFGVREGELGGLEDNSYSIGNSPRSGWIAIPRLPLDASAGPGALSGEERPFDSFGFSADWLRARNLDPAMLSMIQVAGDSMHPILNAAPLARRHPCRPGRRCGAGQAAGHRPPRLHLAGQREQGLCARGTAGLRCAGDRLRRLEGRAAVSRCRRTLHLPPWRAISGA